MENLNLWEFLTGMREALSEYEEEVAKLAVGLIKSELEERNMISASDGKEYEMRDYLSYLNGATFGIYAATDADDSLNNVLFKLKEKAEQVQIVQPM